MGVIQPHISCEKKPEVSSGLIGASSTVPFGPSLTRVTKGTRVYLQDDPVRDGHLTRLGG